MKKVVKTDDSKFGIGIKRPRINQFLDVEFIIDEGDMDAGEEVDEAILEELQEVAVGLEAEGGDEGQLAHDEGVTQSVRQQAINMMAEEGIEMEANIEREAQSIIPCVCSFSSRFFHYYLFCFLGVWFCSSHS